MPDPGRPLHLLLAEDSEEEALIFQNAFERTGRPSTFYVTRDGEQTMHYLAGAPPFDDRLRYPFPTLLILDLKMPGLFDGFDVLKWLQGHPAYSVTPTIIFTSSNDPDDIRRAYSLGATAYIVKPGNLSRLVEMLKSISQFWGFCEQVEPADRKDLKRRLPGTFRTSLG